MIELRPRTIIIYKGKEFPVRPNSQLLSVLKRLEIVSETVLATRNGELIPEDVHIQEGDVIKLINIISGG